MSYFLIFSGIHPASGDTRQRYQRTRDYRAASCIPWFASVSSQYSRAEVNTHLGISRRRSVRDEIEKADGVGEENAHETSLAPSPGASLCRDIVLTT